MKKIFLIVLQLLFSCIVVPAHPGIGIVKDSEGNIYYTDLKQVWKLSPDGNKTVVVSGVHTHELYMDLQDNLYGEHLWYNGERLDTWGHYAWCLKNNGELVKEIEPTQGFLTNYSFVRDSSGNMYWVERFTSTRFMKKDKAGNISKIAEGKFGFVGWLHATVSGVLYFTAGGKLYRLSPQGEIKILTEDLGSKTTKFTMMGRNYDSYGIWADANDNVYIAMIDSKKVIRVNADGTITTVLKSGAFWTVCSGLFDNNNNLWVLENSATNQVRVRKINPGNNAAVIGTNQFNWLHLFITIACGLLAGSIFLLLKNRLLIIKKRLATT